MNNRVDSYANPIGDRLTKGDDWPSLQGLLLVASGLSIISVMYRIWATQNATVEIIGIPLGLLIWGLELVSPLIVCTFGTVLVNRDVSGEAFQLLRLTTLSNSQIVSGYIFALLYKCRLLLAVTLGLLPFMLLAIDFSGLVFFMPAALTVYGMNFLGAAVGTGVALHIKDGSAAVVVSVLICLALFMLLSAGLCLPLCSPAGPIVLMVVVMHIASKAVRTI